MTATTQEQTNVKQVVPPHAYRLIDFQVGDIAADSSGSGSDKSVGSDATPENKKRFTIRLFGINEKGETASIYVDDYRPFFYVKVSNAWKMKHVNAFASKLRKQMGSYYADDLQSAKLVQRKKLYEFDNYKNHHFVELTFKSVASLSKVKYLFRPSNGYYTCNFQYEKETHECVMYESNIPPLLRYFHIHEISPSGWIQVSGETVIGEEDECKTTCKYEYKASCNQVSALNNIEAIVPYKICSFDIEASSSHGDFPLAKKNYKRLVDQLMEYWDSQDIAVQPPKVQEDTLLSILYTALELVTHDGSCEKDNVSHISYIDKVYIKRRPQTDVLETYIDICAKESISILRSDSNNEKMNEKLVASFGKHLPAVEGDKVTFVGSTFMRYGESEPYLNHCVVLNSCEKSPDVPNYEIESYCDESDLLVAWKEVIQRENPDFIIGYNIFGFDYQFMFQRACENHCEREFLMLSRLQNEVCGKENKQGTKVESIEHSKIVIASGEHDLKYIKMTGRVQVDLYNYFRRDYNLPSYKLDHVASQFIGDKATSIKFKRSGGKLVTEVQTKNMMGLYVGSYVHFEESSHSVDYYKDGEKFKVTKVDLKNKTFQIAGKEQLDMTKNVRWGLAKDDVTPQDIFRLTNESAAGRGIIAKYCIQDCNLVQHLMRKIDVITGYVEMAKICSVPMEFLVMRGQGIKLTSFIAKECRKKNTLMPVLEKGQANEGYEGAIVLEPKCDLYLDNPVACVDYASLYPSSMISENLSHDSKVWTKEYDLGGRLLSSSGVTNAKGEYIYDNLPDYDYVEIVYDTYNYSDAGSKTLCGKKVCRWAQRKDGQKAIMPSILEELLAARKSTRKLIPQQTDDFMKNILDKRQLSYKVTANSLYGQCGAKTSTFYEKDVAASTTATGRMLLTYAKRMIEDVYGNKVCETKALGTVRSKAEYVYGDTDSVFFTFNLEHVETGEKIVGKDALAATIELAQEAGVLASSVLKKPHDLEYEKTFMPFCLLSKKRYVGMLYEDDVDKCCQKSMGIVLKRRDNAPIVKDIYGGIIEILMKDKDIHKAVAFLRECLDKMVNKKYPIEKLVITKSLRSGYKNPKQIAHKVLADRIAERDPGNKPSSGDRIPFVYIVKKGRGLLQGDKIELPSYIEENKLKIDYGFYISNQIMKPVNQVFALVLEKLIANKASALRKMQQQFVSWRLEFQDNDEKYQKQCTSYREKYAKNLLFGQYLEQIEKENKIITGKASICHYFGKK